MNLAQALGRTGMVPVKFKNLDLITDHGLDQSINILLDQLLEVQASESYRTTILDRIDKVKEEKRARHDNK